MMLNIYNKENNEPESRDILDLNLDMKIEEQDNIFYVDLNSTYRLYDSFDSKESAMERMFFIANMRNKLEMELRDF